MQRRRRSRARCGRAGLAGAAIVLGAIGCGSVGSSEDAPAPVPDAAIPDAARPCDPLAAFGPRMPLAGLSGTAAIEGAPRLTPDELTLYVAVRQDPAAQADLYDSHRADLAAPFSAPRLLTALNSSFDDFDPYPTSDGKTLWFASKRVAAEGNHLYVATRSSTLVEFSDHGPAAIVAASDVKVTDAQPFVTVDNEELWFTSSRVPNLGALDVWRSTRSGAGFGQPEAMAELSSDADDFFPTLSADRLTLYLSSRRAGGLFEVYRAHRNSVTDAFSALVPVDELNSPGNDFATWISADNCRIYGTSDSTGNDELFVATRTP